MIKVDPYLDEKNQALWKNLSSNLNIILEESLEENYALNIKENVYTVFVKTQNPKSASFSHELLHIHLHSKNIRVGNDLKEKINNVDDLLLLFSYELKEHIGNCLEHVKMLPAFIQLGYKRKEFIEDFNKMKMKPNEINDITRFYKENSVYNRDAVDLFIGKFFAMKSCPNPEHDYSKMYKKLQNIDPKLYKILNEFWEDWLTFDVNNPNDAHDEILDIFVEDMEAWIKNKIMF